MKSLTHRIGAMWHSRPVALKMFSFAVIGVGNTVIDLSVFTFAYKVLELPLVGSNVLAWLVAVSGSYVMNTNITFRAELWGCILRGKDYLRSHRLQRPRGDHDHHDIGRTVQLHAGDRRQTWRRSSRGSLSISRCRILWCFGPRRRANHGP